MKITATTHCAVRGNPKLRLMLTNMRIKIVIAPSVTNDQLIILFDRFFILESSYHELMIVDGLLHYGDRFYCFTTYKVFFDYNAFIIPGLEGTPDTEKDEIALPMPTR